MQSTALAPLADLPDDVRRTVAQQQAERFARVILRVRREERVHLRRIKSLGTVAPVDVRIRSPDPRCVSSGTVAREGHHRAASSTGRAADS